MSFAKYKNANFDITVDALLNKMITVRDTEKLGDKLGLKYFQIKNIIKAAEKVKEYRNMAVDSIESGDIGLCMYYMLLLDNCMNVINRLDSYFDVIFTNIEDEEPYRSILYQYTLIQSYLVPLVVDSARVICSEVHNIIDDKYDFYIEFNSTRNNFKYTDIFDIQAYHTERLNMKVSSLSKIINSVK